MAQKRMLDPLKQLLCRERKGANTWRKWGKPKETHGVPKGHPSFQTEANTWDCQENGAKNPSGFAVLFKETIDQGAQTNA